MDAADVKCKTNKSVAKALDLTQRLFSLFLANALPAITGGAVIGVPVARAAVLAGFIAVVQVVQKLAFASTDGNLTAEEIAEAFGRPTKKK